MPNQPVNLTRSRWLPQSISVLIGSPSFIAGKLPWWLSEFEMVDSLEIGRMYESEVNGGW